MPKNVILTFSEKRKMREDVFSLQLLFKKNKTAKLLKEIISN